jgi:UPF0176 protein
LLQTASNLLFTGQMSTMTLKVAAFYQFISLPDIRASREPLRLRCLDLGLRGSILLADEGINGTIAGPAFGIDTLMAELQSGHLLGPRLDRLELKFSTAATMPFQRLKIRLKREIVTLGDPTCQPALRAGIEIDAADWNDLISTPETIVIDTRNQFEVAMGTFEGAIDPGITRFSQFREFAAQTLMPHRQQNIALFCTGGIRCEKASSHLLAQGFRNVYQLKGGILRYLERISQAQSRWRGGCFVFDERVALGHGLIELEAEKLPAPQHRITSDA